MNVADISSKGDSSFAASVDLQLKLTRDLHLIMTHPGRQIMA
jgi:hypothetical protein